VCAHFEAVNFLLKVENSGSPGGFGTTGAAGALKRHSHRATFTSWSRRLAALPAARPSAEKKIFSPRYQSSRWARCQQWSQIFQVAIWGIAIIHGTCRHLGVANEASTGT
jgi:hypothetical protein